MFHIQCIYIYIYIYSIVFVTVIDPKNYRCFKCNTYSYMYPTLPAVRPTVGFVALVSSKLTLSFPFLDAGTRDVVCACWADVFMLLATLVRRDSSAAYPSVSAALGRRWRTFAGTQSLCCACVCAFIACYSMSERNYINYSGLGC